MTRHLTVRLAILLVLGLLAAACTSEPDEVIAGDADSDVPTEQANKLAPESEQEPVEASVADDSAPIEVDADTQLPAPTNLANLGGSLWAITHVDGERYEDGWISIEGDADPYHAEFVDQCSAGRLGFRVESGQLSMFSFRENVPCPGHPTAFFGGDGERGSRFDVDPQLDNAQLTLTRPTGTLVAEYHSSGSAINAAPRLPSLPAIDLEVPDTNDYATIPEATDIPIPACASSGRLGLEDDPLAHERLATSQRINLVAFELPFVVWTSGAGGNLYHHEMGIGLSVRYQPTIDWLVENIPEGHVCLGVPPLGYYETGASLIPWELVETPEPGTTVVVRHKAECSPAEHQVMDPQVVVTDTEVQIGLPLRQPAYGQGSEDVCRLSAPFEVALPEPIGERAVVPATKVIRRN